MTSEPMTPERFAAIKARHQEVKRLYGEFWVDAGPTDADLDAVLAEVERLRCTDPIECGHEAALGQAQEEVARLTVEVDEGRNVIEAVRSITGGGRLPSEWSKTWRARAEKAEAALAEATETLAELAFAEDRSDEDRLRTERNEWMTRAEKAEAALSAVWAEVERWDQSHVSSSSMRQIVRDLFAIRDRAESSSPTEEKA